MVQQGSIPKFGVMTDVTFRAAAGWTGGMTFTNEGRPVSFSRWKAALAASKSSAGQRWRFATEISRFLRYCQILNATVTRPRAREYLSIVPLVSARPDARLALRWFFEAAHDTERCRGRRQTGSGLDRSASAENSPPGGEDWAAEITPRDEWWRAGGTAPAIEPGEEVDSERSNP